MNGRRGTSGVSVVPGCPDGSRSVGRPDLHTEAGFFLFALPVVRSLTQKRLPQFEQVCIGEVRARLLRAGAKTASGLFTPVLP